MDKNDDAHENRELTALKAELGLSHPPLPVEDALPQAATSISLNILGESITVWVPPSGRHVLRRRFKELSRNEKRRAADAGNAATTSQLLAGSIGGALATSGVIAFATATGPLAVAAIVASAVGAAIASAGFIAGHWMNKKKFEHEERMEYYNEIAEDLK